MKILLIEDDRDIVRFVKKGLLENSYFVDVAFDGETGLCSALQQHYDLILLSKFDATQVELKMAPLRLDLLVKDLCNIFQVLAEQNKIAMDVDTLPEVMVMGDKMRLQQLFTNLIDNAIKYTSEGSIDITMGKNKEYVFVKVKDTGIGIPQEEQEKIFKRFYRVDKSRSRETGGVGLGLSIAEWIAHAHHGRIEVYSQVNQGSTFTVYLPILKA